MIIKLLVDGGNMKPGPTLSQKLGPLGINIGKVISEINEATKTFSGLKVPVELDVNVKSKNFKIKVLSPPVVELLKKELSIEKGSPDMKNVKVGNLSIEQIIKIAKMKQQNMLSKTLKACVKNVLGTCVSAGILVENKDPKEVIKEVDKGLYDDEILNEKTIPDKEKLKFLQETFSKIKAKQEEIKKKLEEEKTAEEIKKQVTETSTTGVGAKATSTKPTQIEEKKSTSKK